MDERILEQLKLLNRYVQYLEHIAKADQEKLTTDFVLRGGAERYLQLAIESCINIGNRILSLLQDNAPVKSPETYSDIFHEMARHGVIPMHFLDTVLNMVRFRNRIVHMYWDIDPAQLHDILRQHLGDFVAYRDHVMAFINAGRLMKKT